MAAWLSCFICYHSWCQESDCDLPKDREDDLGVVAAMLHEMSCDDVAVLKVIRLGKRSTAATY